VLEEIVYGRHQKSKTWGLYGGEGNFEELIKPVYDSITMHEYPQVYEVWKDGKVGYYNSDFKWVKAPDYDAFQYLYLDYTYACALKKGENWQLYDAFDRDVLLEDKALEELQELWLNRH